jgi:hypothetical protein
LDIISKFLLAEDLLAKPFLGVPKSTHRRYILRTKSMKNDFAFIRGYVLIMGKMTALFLQDLLDLASFSPIQTIDEKYYFLCTTKFLENSSMPWTANEQRYHLGILQDKGFVHLIKKGIPPRRWIFIDIVALENAVDQAIEAKENSQSVEKLRRN